MLMLGFRGLIGSLTNDVIEQRRLTGTGISAFLGHDFEQIFRQLVYMRFKKKLSDTNLIMSRHIEREKASFPLDVRCSKTPLLKLYLTTAARVAQLVENLTAEREVMGSIPGPNQ